MKNLSAIINAALLIAVGILYYLHFKRPAEQGYSTLPSPVAGSGIVFVNTDSLLDRYTFFKNKKDEFEKKNEEIKRELNTESENLQNEAQQYQQNAASMSKVERDKKEQGLMQKQQALVKRKDALMATLDEEQNKFHEELYGRLSAYLKNNNKGKNYAFVLGYSPGGGILFANDSLDITGQMVEGLNKEFEKEK